MQRRFFAQNGRPGAGRKRDGAGGADVFVEVPPGTIVFDSDGDEQLLDLTEPGSRTVFLHGGRGGKGNTHFKSSRMQTPRFAQPGEEGVEKKLRIELRIIADVGFVGLPNAGKSTLLKVLTAAQPKIGNYPFTTVIPNLGVMHHHERDVVLADIPGIIAGAHKGAGLGIQFLKHIARTRGLVYVIESTDENLEGTYQTLRSELSAFSRSLAVKKHILVISKSDLIDAGQVDPEKVKQFLRVHTPDGSLVTSTQTVSAVTRGGLNQLRDALFALVSETADKPEVFDSGELE
jgi:GTP-binding protein